MKTILSAASALALVFFANLASAAEVPFNQGQFDSAKAAGLVALHVKPDKTPELKRETFTA